VTLGLVGVAALSLPQLAAPITTTGMAVVALNLLVGPITLRRALAQLREIPEREPPLSASGAVPTPAPSTLPPRESSPRPPAPLPEPLRGLHDGVARELARILDDFDARVEPELPALPELGDTAPALDEFRAAVVAQRDQ